MAFYYVRPNGSDSNTGTGYLASQAFKNVGKALFVMAAGDTTFVAPGFYPGGGCTFEAGGVDSDNCTSLKGDPWCNYFLDMTPGEVILGNREGLHSTTLNSGPAFLFGSDSNVLIENMTIEAGTGYALQGGTGVNQFLINCTVYGDLYGFARNSTTFSLNAKRSKFYRTNTVSCFSMLFENCYFSNLQMNFGSALTTCQFYSCIINLSTTILSSYSATNASHLLEFIGCHLYVGSGGTSAAGYCITFPTNSKCQLNIKQCLIEGAGNFIDGFSYTNAGIVHITECMFKNVWQAIKRGTSTGNWSVYYTQFLNVFQPVSATSASYPITVYQGKVEGCVYLGSANVTFNETDFAFGGNANGATLTNCTYTNNQTRRRGLYTDAGKLVIPCGDLTYNNYYMPGTVYHFFMNCTAGQTAYISFSAQTNATLAAVSITIGNDTSTYLISSSDGLVSMTAPYNHYSTEKVLVMITAYSQNVHTVSITDISY